MISIEKLHGYLNKDQKPDIMAEKVFKIPESKIADGHIYGKYILNGKFAFLGKEIIPVPLWTELGENYLQLIDKTAVKKNSFIISILNQIMPEFRYFDVKSRINFAKDLLRQIAFDMEEKALYKEMEYTRQRNNIRAKFVEAEDIDNDLPLKKIIVDYFSLTVYVLKKDSDEKFGRVRIVEKLAFVPGVWKKTDREEEYTIKNPSCFLIENEGRYYSVVKKELNGLFSWQDEGMEEIFRELSQESRKTTKTTVKKTAKKTVTLDFDETSEIEEKIATSDEADADEEIIVKKSKAEESAPTISAPTISAPTISASTIQSSADENESEEVTGTVSKGRCIPKKITLAEIQAIAETEGISITKKSDKTGKELKKSIQELREEIMKKYE